ncbi:MAG: TonB family protein [Armatimonadota bacterium]
MIRHAVLLLPIITLGIAVPGLAQVPTEQDLDEPVERLRCPLPPFPADLRHAGIEGSVTLRFVVDTAGSVERGSVAVVSATDPGFEAPAREMLADCEFRPGRIGGRPVQASLEVPVMFRLAGAPRGRVFVEQELGEPVQRLRCPLPAYPAALREASIEGSVTLRLIVDTTGQVEVGSVVVVSGTNPEFQVPATEMAVNCQLRPGRVAGKPVRASVQMPILFRLAKKGPDW